MLWEWNNWRRWSYQWLWEKTGAIAI
jgi:hypothetical protein